MAFDVWFYCIADGLLMIQYNTLFSKTKRAFSKIYYLFGVRDLILHKPVSYVV